MKGCRLCAVLTFFILSFWAVAGAARDAWQVIIENAYGSINWTQGTVQASGTGAPPGRGAEPGKSADAARLSAQKRLLRLVQKIDINSRRTVGDLFSDDPEIPEALNAMIRRLPPVEPITVFSNGKTSITLQMSLYGEFSQRVLPKDIKQIEPIKPVGPVKPGPPAASANRTDAQAPGLRPDVHTGMIVDATGLSEVKPAMVPTIVDETGKEIYGPAFVSREHAVKTGMCGYMHDINRARSDPRVQPNPLIVKGLKTKSPGRSVIVVSNADAAKLRSASEHLSFLRQCRVIIVVD